MPSQSSQVILVSQCFEAAIIPERGEGGNEATRLRTALFGVYEYVLVQKPHYEFRSAVVYNSERSVLYEGQEHFKVEEKVNGAQRTLTLECSSDDLSIERVELIPLDMNSRPIDYMTLEATAERRTIRYWQDDLPHKLKIRLSELNVIEIESVNACVWVDGMPEVQFSVPQNTYLDRHDGIRVDLLDNPDEQERTLKQSLYSLFVNVFGEAFGRELSLSCAYRFQQNKGLPEIDLPVLQIPSTSYSEDLSRSVSSALKNWYREADVASSQGTFIFDLTVFSTRVVEKRPVLKLIRLLLPIESTSDLNDKIL